MSYSAGIVKPKITSNSSIKRSVSSSMASATRSTGASSAMSRTGSLFGIYAQRSTTGLGLHNNYLNYNSSSTSDLRHSLNDNRIPLFNNIGFAPMPHHHEDNSNKFMGIMMGIGMGIGLLNTIMKGIADLKAADGTDGTTPKKTAGDNNDTGAKGINGGSSKADSLGDLQAQEKGIDTKLNSFGAEYKEVNREEKQAIQDALSEANVQAGLKNAGIDNIDFSKLDLNEINIGAESEEADFDTALGSIDTDIKEVKSFKDDTLGPAKEKLSDKAGEIQKDIKSTESSIKKNESKLYNLKSQLSTAPSEQKAAIQKQITELQAQIDKDKNKLQDLQKQKEEVSAAQTAIQSAESNCDNLVKQLNEQKTQLEDLKDQKSEIDKKQYKLAEQQSEDFQKNKTKMYALETKIKYETDPEKKSKLIGQWNELAGEMSSLYESLSSVNGQEFSGKKGSVKVSIDSGDIKYTRQLDEGGLAVLDNQESKGISLADNMQMINKIKGTQVGQTVIVNGDTYTKNLDGSFSLTEESQFKSNIPSANELKSQFAGNAPNISISEFKPFYKEDDLIKMATTPKINLDQD